MFWILLSDLSIAIINLIVTNLSKIKLSVNVIKSVGRAIIKTSAVYLLLI